LIESFWVCTFCAPFAEAAKGSRLNLMDALLKFGVILKREPAGGQSQRRKSVSQIAVSREQKPILLVNSLIIIFSFRHDNPHIAAGRYNFLHSHFMRLNITARGNALHLYIPRLA